MTYIEETNKQIKSLSLQQKEFYQLVGLCIKAWATVEDKLFDICELVLKTNQQLVAIIFYKGHPKATRAYAWSSPIKGSHKRRFFAVLHTGQIKSPVDAVRAGIVAEQRGS